MYECVPLVHPWCVFNLYKTRTSPVLYYDEMRTRIDNIIRNYNIRRVNERTPTLVAFHFRCFVVFRIMCVWVKKKSVVYTLSTCGSLYYDNDNDAYSKGQTHIYTYIHEPFCMYSMLCVCVCKMYK